MTETRPGLALGDAMPASPAPKRWRRSAPADPRQRAITSPLTRSSRRGRTVYWSAFGLLALALGLIALGPLFWLASGSLKSTTEIITTPPSLFPSEFQWGNYSYVWNTLELPKYLWNTVFLAVGTLVFQLVVAIAAAFAFSILQPRGSRILFGLVIATLFVPATVLFIPTYVTIVDLPILHTNLIGSPLAIWLPQAASALNIFILKRFFDQIPRELIDAARVDGARSYQTLRYIVLPLSRPIIAVVAIFALIASWKDFLWPLIVLPNPEDQPLSVILTRLELRVELKYILVGLVIAAIPPIVAFLVFQRKIVSGLADAGINR